MPRKIVLHETDDMIKKDEFVPTNSRLFPSLPPEITKNITGYLPYSRHIMRRVSKTWRHNIALYLTLPTREDVLRSCHSALDAVAILSDEKYFGELYLNELLILAAWLPEIVEDKALQDLLDWKKKLVLLRNNPSKVMAHLISNVQFTDAQIHDLFDNNAELPQAILEDKTICYQLPPKVLAMIGQSSQENAFKIYNDEKLRKMLGNGMLGDGVLDLARRYPKLARTIIQDSNERKKMAGYYLVNFARMDESIALIIVNDKEKFDSLLVQDWIDIASSHKRIALKILAEGKLTCRRKIIGLVKDPSTAVAVIRYLIHKKISYNMDDLCLIAKYYDRFALDILKRYQSSLSVLNLLRLAHASEKVGLEILTDPQIRAKALSIPGIIKLWASISYPKVMAELAKHVDLTQAIYLAERRPDMAEIFFDEACKRFTVSSYALRNFGAENKHLAMKILRDPNLVNTLHRPDLAEMIKYSADAMFFVLNTPKLRARLPKNSKRIFSSSDLDYANISQPRNSRIILNDPVLREKLSVHEKVLEKGLNIASRIHELAKAYRTKYLLNAVPEDKEAIAKGPRV